MKNNINGRRQTREWILQFIFQLDFNPESIEQSLFDFWNDKEISKNEKQFADSLIQGVINYKDELDQKLSSYTKGWDTDRLGSIDRAIMRIALYEMLFCNDTPPVVVINEAVHFAKDFSGYQSGRFVNGVLDSISKELDRSKKNPNASSEL